MAKNRRLTAREKSAAAAKISAQADYKSAATDSQKNSAATYLLMQFYNNYLFLLFQDYWLYFLYILFMKDTMKISNKFEL